MVHRVNEACDAEGVEDISMLNMVVSDGYTLIATRYIRDIRDLGEQAASLYFASGSGYVSSPEG